MTVVVSKRDGEDLCPSEAAFAALVRGELGAAERSSLHEHIERCADCYALLREIAPASGPEAALEGQSTSEYRLVDLLGEGGMGIVYRASDARLDRIVALKLLPQAPADSTAKTAATKTYEQSAPAAETRFLREARITARLQHPSIVPIYQVGRWPTGEAFYTMRLISGRSLLDLINAAASLQERLALLPHVLAAADATGYAHSEGVIHRDLKPANIMAGPFGETLVIDWGLAKALDGDNEDEALIGAAAPRPAPEPLTHAGHVLGTPAYMAPEQARSAAVDARADVYALGAILYHLLTGTPPRSASTTPTAIGHATAGARRALPSPAVARDLLAIVAKAMADDPRQRYPSAKELAEDLRRFLTGQLVGAHAYSLGLRVRHWLKRHRFAALLSTVPILLGLAYASAQLRAHHQLTAVIARRLHEAAGVLARARATERTLGELRTRAYAAFDAGDSDVGEATWERVQSLEAEASAGYGRASQLLEMALALDGSRHATRHRFADLLDERAWRAERNHRPAERDELRARSLAYDDDGSRRARWNAPGHLTLASTPSGATVSLQSYVDQGGRSSLTPPQPLGPTPIVDRPLAAGSYLLTLSLPGRLPVRYPLLVARGESLRLIVPIPERVPDGFVFIPAGRFLYGSSDTESERRWWLLAQPLHQRSTGAYLIGHHEVTFAEWIEFLDALPSAERARRLPHVVAQTPDGSGALLALTPTAAGTYRLTLQPTTRAYSAAANEPLRYSDRTDGVEQRWLHIPVSGISWDDARAYAAWLDQTGRLPGARLCSELEWERAARGADDRLFPSGNRLSPSDANIDETYRRQPLAFGPDEVGSHPASDSPFGVADLAGNVWEWLASSNANETALIRGGSWYQHQLSSRSNNREPGEPSMRGIVIGLRICASASNL